MSGLLPSQFPEVNTSIELQKLLGTHVNMQFEEVRKMFLSDGFNFPLSSYLFDLLAGTSIVLYYPSKKKLLSHNKRGAHFTKLIRSRYPKERDLPIRRKQMADILWGIGRNPLAHALGIDLPSRGSIAEDVALAKRKLSQDELDQLETSVPRPSFCSPTITVNKSPHKTIYTVSTATVYWGLNRTLHSIFSSKGQLTEAERLARKVNEFMALK